MDINIRSADDGSFVITTCDCGEESSVEMKTYTASDMNSMLDQVRSLAGKSSDSEEYDKGFDEAMQEPEDPEEEVEEEPEGKKREPMFYTEDMKKNKKKGMM